jgi:hypothetical protein
MERRTAMSDRLLARRPETANDMRRCIGWAFYRTRAGLSRRRPVEASKKRLVLVVQDT